MRKLFKVEIFNIKTVFCRFTICLVLLTFCTPSIIAQSVSKPGIKSVESKITSLINASEESWVTNKSESDSLISLAFKLIDDINYSDSTVLAEAYHILGKNQVEKRNYSESVNTLKKSAHLKSRYLPDDHKSLSKTINYTGLSFLYNQNYDSAIYYFKKARIPLIKNDIWDLNLFYVYLNIGIGYSSLGQYNEALEYFDTVLVVLDKSGLINDSNFVSRYNYNYALFTTFTGKLKDANEYYEKSANIYRHMHGENYIALAGINNNKGINSYLGYEFAKAELYLKRALEVYAANGISNDIRIAQIYVNLSQICIDKGDFHCAISYCEKGLDDEPNEDIKITLYKNLAISYAEINDNKQANSYFNKALELLNSDNINPIRIQNVYTKYADFLINSGDKNALNYYKKALKSASELNGNDSKQYAEVLFSIGNYYLELERLANNALKYFEQSKNIFESIYQENQGDHLSIIQLKEAEIGIASSYLLKYKTENNIDYLKKADTVFTEVLNKMEEISSQLTTVNKLLLIELLNPVYLIAVNNAFELYNLTTNTIYLEKVASYIERSKSAALLAEVNSENALKTSDIPDDIFNFEHEMKDEINGIRQLLGNESIKAVPDSVKIRYFETKLLELLNDYDSLISDIEINYPKYYSIKYYNDAISLEKIQSNLADDEIILEYMLTDSVVYIMAITKDDFDIKRVTTGEDFYNSLNYIISIKNVDLSDQNLASFNEFKRHSYFLWKTLIKPHIELVGSKRLIIIPDGLLGYLPFDILIEYDFEAEKIKYRDLPFLIRNHPISYSYSATIRYNNYFDPDPGSKLENKSILAFAPSYDTEKSRNENLGELKFAKPEVENIVSNYGGKSFINSRATKENFLNNAESSDILHLAMHTIINDSLPLQSKLVFYGSDGDSTSNYMYTHEIYNLDINAAMVTLSACNTGSGELRKGEGIMSLARGFVYAGVPSIVITLWEVQDVTGSKIMDYYYENLSEGMKKDEALQKAKLKTLNSANMANAHPFFWSAYIINGDTSEIIVTQDSKSYYWILGGVIIIILLVILSIRRYKLKQRYKL